MKNGVPETLEEALYLIEEQNKELQKKQEEIDKKQDEIAKVCIEINKKQDEINKAKNEINKALAEIVHLNEQLAIKRAREFAARSEKSSRINPEQKELPFDIESQSLENAAKEEDSKLTEETEISVLEEEKSPKKSKAGRKSVSKINNNLAKRRYVITLPAEERICDKCGTMIKKVRVQVNERVVHVPSYEYIEIVEKEVYECPNCVNDDDSPSYKNCKRQANHRTFNCNTITSFAHFYGKISAAHSVLLPGRKL